MPGPSRSSIVRTSAHAMRSTVSPVPSRPYSFVLIVAIALSLASCKTARKAQTEQKTQTQAELRSDSLASQSQTSETLTQTSQQSETEWAQTWTMQPLSSGGFTLTTRGKQTQRKAAVAAQAEHKADSLKVVRSHFEQHSSDVVTQEKKPPDNSVGGILGVWVLGMALLILIGCSIVKLQKRK